MKVLFLAGHEFLYKPQNGGQKCSLRNYELLVNILGSENVYLCMFSNYKYSILPNNAKIFPTQKTTIEKIKNTVSFRNVCNKNVQKQVINYINSLDYDLLFIDSSTIGGWLKKLATTKPSIVFFHNIEKNYAWNKVVHENPGYFIAYLSYFYNEYIAVKYATNLIVLNERDKKLLKQIYQRNANLILPISFDDVFSVKDSSKYKICKKELLFVGSLFQPNIEGIQWFVDQVMPLLPNYKLIIVGKGLEQKKEHLTKTNVEVVGSVESLNDYYYSADAVVIPIFYGDGMKVKTAEALMYGKTIFASKEALEGYNINGLTHIFECNSKDEYIHSIKNHFSKDHSKVNQDVRNLFLTQYSNNSLKEKLAAFLFNTVKH